MKIRLFLMSLFVAFAAAGCGKNDSQPSSGSSAAQSGTAAAPAKSGPRVVEITAGDNMKFSLQTIEAKPGEELKLVLVNIGTQPKEVMGHNWVLLKSDANAGAFAAAAAAAKANDYVPPALKDQIIAHTALIGPRKSDEITFKVPDAPGEYPYICSFPAHYQVGMKGTLVVK
ncbi:MAG TPA: plastocyanin/azurin family copper-binding protein [Opitutus sp.]|nr:plastocyanin/azurin family copper-binding protein [Opitutus sp.]